MSRVTGAQSEDPIRGRVLVVDDEPTIAEVVSRYLERARYETRQAHGGPEAVGVACSWRPDLIVLDQMLPGFDGLEVMRRIREAELGDADGRGPAAVILLTARTEESDRIIGLRRGADDYVVKPFSPAELVARVDAVMRRGHRAANRRDAAVIQADGLTIDPAGRSVEVAGRAVSLTAREFDLLVHLASNPGRVFTRNQLMESVWDTPFFTDVSTVTVHVRRVRAKIEPDPRRPRFIETARGVGYRFRSNRRIASSLEPE